MGKGTISISTILLLGIAAYLLLRPQNAQAEDNNASSNESTDNTGTSVTGDPNLDKQLGLVTDKTEEAAVNAGKAIGEYKAALAIKNHIDSVREGWQTAIELWKKYKNAKTNSDKKKTKYYVGMVILSCNNSTRTFAEAYNHLSWSQGDITAITTGYEWGAIWKKLSSQDQQCLSDMNSFATSNEYAKWHNEID